MDLIFTNGKKLKVGTFYGIGKNYAKHAKEMGGEIPEEPIIFIKPGSSYIPDGGTILMPHFSENVHHEVELVVVIGKECRNVKKEDAIDYIAGYAVGLDVTLRDIQNKAKKEGNPWAISKGFATSAPVSKVAPAEDFMGFTPDFMLELKINGELRQKAYTIDLLHPVDELIEYLLNIFVLEPGDCIFTGTPKASGPIHAGDKLFAELLGIVSLEVNVEMK